MLDRGEPPWVLFICQHETHRDKFLAAADRDLTGHLWHPAADPSEKHYPGRRRTLFACEADIHAGTLEALRVPGYPPGHPARRDQLAEARGVRLPGPAAARPAATEPKPTGPPDCPAPPDPQRSAKPPERYAATR